MKLCVLGSGSKGNAYYVEAGETSILIDAGFTGRELRRRLSAIGVDPSRISAIFVSHEHTDHVAGLRVLGRCFTVFATEGTFREISSRFELNGRGVIRAGESCKVGSLEVLPVPLSHDAIEPVGFVVDDGVSRVGILTDQGQVTRVIEHRLRDLDLAVLEANHDAEMLINGPYRWDLKQRIKSRVGHLANHETASLLETIMHSGLKHVMLAHLSEINNRPELALSAVEEIALDNGARPTVCAQDRPGEMVCLG